MKTCNPVRNFSPRSFLRGTLAALVTVAAVSHCPIRASAAPGLAVQPMSSSSYALDVNGKLYVWGKNDTYGQLGIGNTTNQPSPVPEPLPQGVAGWQAVAGGTSHTLVLANNGQLYAAGANYAGALGLGFVGYPQTNLAHVPLPAGVTGWTSIAAGSDSSRAIDNNHQLYAWGNSSDGQLGLTNLNPASPVLVPLPAGITGWKAVAASEQHTLALSLDGRLFVTGQNSYGQLGDGTALIRWQFEPLPFPQGVTNWQAVACGFHSSFALSSGGQLFAWGYNQFGELGIGTNSPSNTNRPCRVLLPPGITGWKSVSVGARHTLGLANNDQLYAWGANLNYQLGIGATQASVFSPTPVLKPAGVTNWVAIAAGATHSLALGENCQLYVWGDNAYGELGLAGYQDTLGVPTWLVPLGSVCSPPPPPRGWPGVTITATDPTAAEARNPDGSLNTAAFRLTRNGNLQTNLIVDVAVSGTAIYAVDYQTVPQLEVSQEGNRPTPLYIPPGTNSVTVLVTPLDDNLAELNETLVLTIVSNPAAAYIIGQPSSATVTILEDNDTNGPPTITLTYPPASPGSATGVRFATGNNIPLCARVFDPDANAQTLEFFVDQVSRGVVNLSDTITNPANYRTTNFTQLLSLVVPTLGPGPHSAFAQVTDQFGAQATTPPTSFTVLTPGLTPPATPAVAAEPYSMSSYLVDGNGALYVWGQGTLGQLGDNLAANQVIPTQLALPDGATAWTQVSGGQSHALALANNGRLYAWGYACCGQLGTGVGANSPNQLLPVQVPLPAGVSAWRKASAGANFSVAIADQGQLFAWGNNFAGQLGIGSTVYQYTPVPVPFPDGVTNWTDVAAGSIHTLALAGNGILYAWGGNSEGELGNNLVANDNEFGVSHPVPVLSPNGVNGWGQITAGGYHSFAFDNQGNLYGWGYNNFGQVAPGGSNIVHLPLLIPSPGSPWVAVAGGSYHTLALAADGNIYPWGYSTSGQLGLGSSGRTVQLPDGATRWQSIGAGQYHSLAVADNCQVYAWGNDTYGQLGNGPQGEGTGANRSTPVPAQLSSQLCYLFVNQPPSFTKGPDMTVVGDSGAHVIPNWATNIVAGAPWETNQLLNFIVTNNSNSLFTVQPALSPDGTLSFTLAKDHTGSALVTVVLHDNGGTANGGQDTSAPQTFILTVTKADDAPVVVIRVFPEFQLSPLDTNHTVLSTNYLSADVIFDASLTTNSAGDPMSFAWFDDGATNPFAASPVAERTLTLGTHLIRLTVSSGDDVSAGSVQVQVITTGQAVSELLQRVQNLGLGPPVDNLLENALESAQKAFDQGLAWVGDVHLAVFQTKVRDHLAASQPALAADFIHIAQEIMDASAAPTSPAAPVVALKAAGQGRQHLEFTGTPGALHLVQVTTNLVDWDTIGVATEVSPGKFEYADPGATAAPSRFYRLRLP